MVGISVTHWFPHRGTSGNAFRSISAEFGAFGDDYLDVTVFCPDGSSVAHQIARTGAKSLSENRAKNDEEEGSLDARIRNAFEAFVAPEDNYPLVDFLKSVSNDFAEPYQAAVKGFENARDSFANNARELLSALRCKAGRTTCSVVIEREIEQVDEDRRKADPSDTATAGFDINNDGVEPDFDEWIIDELNGAFDTAQGGSGVESFEDNGYAWDTEPESEPEPGPGNMPAECASTRDYIFWSISRVDVHGASVSGTSGGDGVRADMWKTENGLRLDGGDFFAVDAPRIDLLGPLGVNGEGSDLLNDPHDTYYSCVTQKRDNGSSLYSWTQRSGYIEITRYVPCDDNYAYVEANFMCQGESSYGFGSGTSTGVFSGRLYK